MLKLEYKNILMTENLDLDSILIILYYNIISLEMTSQCMEIHPMEAYCYMMMKWGI